MAKASPMSEEFHDWLMEGQEVPPRAETRTYAIEILGPQRVDAALVDRDIFLHIGKCVDLWPATTKLGQSNRLPQLLFSHSIIRGETASAEDLIEKIEGILRKAREQEQQKQSATSAGELP